MRVQALLFPILALALIAAPAYASTTEGTISDGANYAWGENMGWINFTPDSEGLAITDSAITGYAWSSTAGWINFSPTDSGQGVTNTPEGVLGGSAWVQNLGWLDMSGVTINSSGEFSGTAGTEGSAAGRVSFDCDHCDVETDWRPVSVRNSSSPVPSASGNGAPSGSLGVANTPPLTPSRKTTAPPPSQAAVLSSLHLPPLTTSAHPVSAFNQPLTVTQAQAGQLMQTFGQNTVVVDIPGGASTSTLTITIVQNPQPADQLGGATFIGGVVFDVTARDSSGVAVHQFDKPLTITLSIPEPLQGNDIGVYWLDEQAHGWELVPGTTFAPSAVMFSVDHLTRFALLRAPGLPQRISEGTSQAHHYWWILAAVLLVLTWLLWKRRKNYRQKR